MKTALVIAVLGLHGIARADERCFSYTYEAEVLPKGGFEFEHSMTNRNGKAEGVYSAFDMREELECGLSDRLTTAIYLNTKSEYQSLTDPLGGPDITTEEFHFEGISSEWKYQLLSPHSAWLGLLLYAELGYNGPEFEAEAKLIVEHRFSDDLVAAVNVVVENEYAYEASHQAITGKSEFDAGISWRLTPAFGIGMEGRNQRLWPDNWGYQGASAWFLGPALHAASEKAWATLTVLPQIAGNPESLSGDGRNLADYEKVETRLLIGVNF